MPQFSAVIIARHDLTRPGDTATNVLNITHGTAPSRDRTEWGTTLLAPVSYRRLARTTPMRDHDPCNDIRVMTGGEKSYYRKMRWVGGWTDGWAGRGYEKVVLAVQG